VLLQLGVPADDGPVDPAPELVPGNPIPLGDGARLGGGDWANAADVIPIAMVTIEKANGNFIGGINYNGTVGKSTSFAAL